MLSHQIKWNTKEYEWFQFVTRSWNVQKAKRILKKKSYESIEIEIDTFAKLLSQEKETSKGRMFVMGVGIDEEKLDKINLDFPLVAVHDPVLESMVIDGWHRIAKAQKLGIKILNGFLLDEEDSRKVLFKTCR